MIAPAEKPNENQKNQTRRGGPRPNSGRKKKPVREMREAIIGELAGTGEVADDLKNDAAGYAFRLFNDTMRDERQPTEVRLNCAEEVLNRVWGKPRQAVELSGRDGKAIEINSGTRDEAGRELESWREEQRRRLAALSTQNAPPMPPTSSTPTG